MPLPWLPPAATTPKVNMAKCTHWQGQKGQPLPGIISSLRRNTSLSQSSCDRKSGFNFLVGTLCGLLKGAAASSDRLPLSSMLVWELSAP
jgi:hypothetical protein